MLLVRIHAWPVVVEMLGRASLIKPAKPVKLLLGTYLPTTPDAGRKVRHNHLTTLELHTQTHLGCLTTSPTTSHAAPYTAAALTLTG